MDNSRTGCDEGWGCSNRTVCGWGNLNMGEAWVSCLNANWMVAWNQSGGSENLGCVGGLAKIRGTPRFLSRRGKLGSLSEADEVKDMDTGTWVIWVARVESFHPAVLRTKWCGQFQKWGGGKDGGSIKIAERIWNSDPRDGEQRWTRKEQQLIGH